MKFNHYFKNRQIDFFKDYYINYKLLKHTIKVRGEFKKIYYQELSKLNNTIQIIVKNNYTTKYPNDIKTFLVLNYMALYKAIKKYDKKFKKFERFNFFIELQNSQFYSFYLNIPRDLHNKTKLIIFDKDGTLIEQNSIFSPWIEGIIFSLCSKLEFYKDTDELFNYLGYNIKTKQFSSTSVVARGTNNDIINALNMFFNKNNICNNYDISKLIDDIWTIPELTDNNNDSVIKTCGDILKIFNHLRKNNIKIAICTNDDRISTRTTIDYLNINSFIDYVVCGDDPISSKPSPEPIWTICQKLGINPNETIIIGDTISDIHAGLNASCGSIIGVLSGNYSDFNIDKADHIIPNIDYIYPLIKY